MTDKEKVLLAWQALTAILSYRKDVLVSDVYAHLLQTPKPHVVAVQLILKGSGFATFGLVADGDCGDETHRSLEQLHHGANID